MTSRILRLDATARASGSYSRQLTDKIVARFDGASVTTRTLNEVFPQIDDAWVAANNTPAAERTAEHQAALSFSDTLIKEVQAADTVVIGLPIYNFMVPTSLKAWVDQIARVGVTFQYGEDGPKGLLTNKRVIVAVASGGTQIGSDYDFATPYLRFMLGFFGITDVTFVGATGLAMDETAALTRADTAISGLAA